MNRFTFGKIYTDTETFSPCRNIFCEEEDTGIKLSIEVYQDANAFDKLEELREKLKNDLSKYSPTDRELEFLIS